MPTKRIAIFAGITVAFIVGGLKWVLPQPAMGAHAVIHYKTNAPKPVSFEVASPASSEKRQLHSDSFIPTSLQQSENPNPGSRNIFGKDARIPMTASDYPWSTIGRLEAPIDAKTVKFCTGTLIGKKLVITNAHCVF